MRRSPSAKASLAVSVGRAGGRIVHIGLAGHAGHAPHGRDIVCAAASALILSAAHGIRSHCKALAVVADDGAGDYSLAVPRGGNARAQAVLESTVSGLRAIARSYPASLRIRAVAGIPASSPKRARPKRAPR